MPHAPSPSGPGPQIPAPVLAEQVARTDAALSVWRNDTAERRRTAWAAEQQRRALEAQQRLMRARIGVTVLCGVLFAVVGVAMATGFIELPWIGTASAPIPEHRAPSSPPVAAPAPPAPTLVAPTEAAHAEAAALASAAEPLPHPSAPTEPSQAVPVSNAPVSTDPGTAEPLQLEPGSAQLWVEEDHQWATFLTRYQGAIELRYLDGAGQPALEPWPCKSTSEGGLRRCTAARSQQRVAHAIAQEGAAPGQWTIQGCSGGHCIDLGRFSAR